MYVFTSKQQITAHGHTGSRRWMEGGFTVVEPLILPEPSVADQPANHYPTHLAVSISSLLCTSN